jgi:hypothetical protein
MTPHERNCFHSFRPNPAYAQVRISGQSTIWRTVSATHRAALNLSALYENGVRRTAPQLTEKQERQLKDVRNAVEHSDEKVLRKNTSPYRIPFDRPETYSLRLSNQHMVIGKWPLSYKTLVSAMTKCHGANRGHPGNGDRNAWIRIPERNTSQHSTPSQTVGNMSPATTHGS